MACLEKRIIMSTKNGMFLNLKFLKFYKIAVLSLTMILFIYLEGIRKCLILYITKYREL